MTDLMWTSDKDQILIEFVKKHKALYNVKCKEYRNTDLKKKLWCEIGAVLNKTDVECSKRWGYVRDYYVRRKANKQEDCSYEVARKRARLLSFLDGVKNSDSSDDLALCEHNLPANNDLAPLKHNLPANEVNSNIFIEVKAERNDDEYNHDEEKTEEKQILERNEPSSDIFDENDHFFRSMAMIVKKLPRAEQVDLRMQISTLVGKAELRHLESSSHKSINKRQVQKIINNLSEKLTGRHEGH